MDLNATSWRMLLLPLVFLLPGACQPALTPDQQSELGRALVIAAHRGDSAEVRRLLDLGVDVDSRCGEAPGSTFQGKDGGWPTASARWTALIAAASSDRDPAEPGGHLGVVGVLIARKASLDLHDGYGATALYQAVYGCRRREAAQIAFALLAAGAEVNTRTGVYIDGPGDTTPLHRAIGSPDLVKALLDRGARVDAVTTHGDTPLHWAVRHRDIGCAKLLLAAGADPNLRDKEGRTALHGVSSIRRKEEMRKLLLNNKDLSDDEKADVLKLLEARVEPQGDLEMLLREAGARD